MIGEVLAGTIILSALGPTPAPVATISSQLNLIEIEPVAVFAGQNKIIVRRNLDLTNRLPNGYGNQIFVDNILLTLHYLKGDAGELRVDKGKPIAGNVDWGKVRQPFEAGFTLKPGQVFAFHDTLLPEFRQLGILTTNAHFIGSEGYKSLASLIGNGVCHLATLINWAATSAGLEVVAKVDHDFYPVPGVPRAFGTSIRYSPTGERNSANQNLYIKNNTNFPVSFNFKADNKNVLLTVSN